MGAKELQAVWRNVISSLYGLFAGIIATANAPFKALLLPRSFLQFPRDL